MAAYDNVSLPGAPNIATAGNYAQLLQQGLSQIPQEYWKGQQQRYEQRQRDFFQDPDNNDLLIRAVRDRDYAPLLQKMAQAGGVQTAQGLLPTILKQPFMDAALQEYTGGQSSGRPVNAGPATNPQAAGPANITGQTQPQRPTQTAQTQGGDTVNSLAAERGVDLDAFLAKYPGVRGLMNRDLSPGEAQQITQRMQAFKGGGGDQPMGSTMAPQRNPVAQPGIQGEDNNNQPVPPGVQTGASSAVSPAPTSASGNIGGAPTAGRATTPATGGAASMVPLGTDPLKYAAALRLRAEALRKRTNLQGVVGIPTKANEDQAAAWDKQADAIIEQLGKSGELTQEQKNLASGATQRGEAIKGQVKSGQEELDSINKLGTAARQNEAKLDLARSFMNSDDYYSGPLEGLNRRFKQWTATLGGDPNKGTPQEAFNKAINDLLSEQIRAMAGSGVGRILLTEVQTMRDSIASQKITPATNRLLVEEVARVHKAQMDIQDAARGYLKDHDYLDPQFQQIISDYYRKSPLFTQKELADPRIIGAPIAPAGMDKQRAMQWARSRGLKTGDPVRTQNGDIIGAP